MPRQLHISQEGFYARKQIFSRSRLISFSHRRRFQVGLDLIGPLADGKRIVDYGCGDGSFIQALLSSDRRPLEVIGAEIGADLVDACRRRFPPRPDLRFVHVNDLTATVADAPIDLIVCMEVLEHVVEPEAVLARMHGLLADTGTIVISVPVETGPPLLFKQAVRRIAGWRGIGDYAWTSKYSLAEYCKSMFAGARQRVIRPVYHGGEGQPYHCHKGFNWRNLELRVAKYFRIRRVLGSPFPTLPPGTGSQVWIVAEKTRQA
ncbi:MAG TPA: class I SAM-dependent methyltransferase [Bryobacteraceae bacterium]|jgi:SAM-dependent methyltransferase